MKKISFGSKLWRSMRARKFTIISIIVICVFGGYEIYKSAIVANAEPQYVLSPVRTGSIIQTVSGTGQVSASNQTDILSQVSGTITGINVSVGQSVSQGQLLATIDSKNAAITLQNAKLSYQK
jgi:multidrug efflux pump subunit AcrA (membrane-fusion protein)